MSGIRAAIIPTDAAIDLLNCRLFSPTYPAVEDIQSDVERFTLWLLPLEKAIVEKRQFYSSS
jgi:hypothetical protein